jgi:hypothetical protein
MARTDTDRAPILCTRTRQGLLAPASSFDAERLERIATGSTVEVTIRQRRSQGNHRHFFAVLGGMVEAGAVPFTSTDAFLDALKMALGVTELRQGIGGMPYFVPASISFAAKDEPAFREFKDKAFALIASHYGISPDDVLKERAA